MMKKIFFATAGLILLMTSCKTTGSECPYSDSSFTAPADEVAALQTYVTNEAPNAVQHTSGIFYVITNPGDNTIKPTICSGITVKYTGYLLPGNTIFESPMNPSAFSLGGLILGWQKGIPLVGKGGTIILYIPPSLAYGAGGTGVIPPNSYLKFEIQLLDVF